MATDPPSTSDVLAVVVREYDEAIAFCVDGNRWNLIQTVALDDGQV